MIPTAAKTVKIHETGEVVDTGIVIMARSSQLTFDHLVSVNGEEAKSHSGELRIVKAFFGFEKYRVELNGHTIYSCDGMSRFSTLAEAAEWAGF